MMITHSDEIILLIYLVLFVFCFVFVCPQNSCSVALTGLELTLDQAGLELTDPPPSSPASGVLGFSVWATHLDLSYKLLLQNIFFMSVYLFCKLRKFILIINIFPVKSKRKNWPDRSSHLLICITNSILHSSILPYLILYISISSVCAHTYINIHTTCAPQESQRGWKMFYSVCLAVIGK